MKLQSILKFTIPAVLISFAGTAFADEGVPATAKATDTRMSAQAKTQTSIGAQVRDKLQSDQRLKNADIETDVSGDGAVLIRGKVNNMEQSQIAEQLASSVAGVSHVKNELQVPRGE